MATKRAHVKVPRYDVTVELVDHHHVHAAIAAGEMPANCAPINLDNVRRWAQRQKPGELHGVRIEKENER